MQISLVATVAAAYFYFNWRYFALVTAVLRQPRLDRLFVAGTFLLNYALFIFCSVMEWTLLLNWGLFFLFQLGETALYCKIGWRVPLYLSLSGILYGLTVNIFCRCAVAIAMMRPLADFDNSSTAYGNMKSLPIFLGFLLGGALLQLMSRPRALDRLRTLIAHPKHMDFQLELLGGMFLYLFLNLLLYQSRGDGVVLKLWGIKSAVFALVGPYLGQRYALKMCQLSDYRERNRAIRQELARSEREERQLRSVAYRDALTGAFSRQYALEQLQRMTRQGERFALCFLDLDDLKGVNDRYGHAQGDRYLVAAARELDRICRPGQDVLARFGGDEFLLLFPGSGASYAKEQVRQAGLRLEALGQGDDFPFPMSLSHGVAESGTYLAPEELLALADGRMYREKQQKAAGKAPPS